MDEWSYKPAPDLERSVTEKLAEFPRHRDMLVYGIRACFAVVLRGWLRTYHRFTVHGREHLPLDVSFVMVCNHASHLDALCMLASVPLGRIHRAFPLAAVDYFFSSPPRTVFSAVLVNGLPFNRAGKGAESLELCGQLLQRPRHILILFPEGTRTMTGEVGPFRSGLGRLVAGTETPVVPCYLAGAREALPKGAGLPRPGRLRLTIGRPRSFANIAPDDRHAVQAVGETMREAVTELASPR